MTTPAEYDELKTWKKTSFILGAVTAGLAFIIFILSAKIHYVNRDYNKQIKQNTVLNEKITDLEGEISIFKAKNESLEDTIFTNEYYLARKDLQNKAKKDFKTKQFVDYLGFLETEVRERSPTAESYNKNLKAILFEKSKAENSYLRANLSRFPPSLLKYFPNK